MKIKYIIVYVIGIITIMCTGCRNSHQNTSIKLDVPYSKKGEIRKELKIEKCKDIVINNYSSDITISKKNINKVNLRIEKQVGGKDKNKVEEAFNKVDYDAKNENNRISIGALFFNILNNDVTSLNIKTYLEIPEYVENLDINSEVGDIKLDNNYESIKIKLDTGNIMYDGIVKHVDTSTKVGDLNFKIRNLDNSSNYKFGTDTGDINISVLKGSKIKLQSDNSKYKIAKDIEITNNGVPFEINRNIGDVFINSY